jgi:hypothetical protein
MIKKGIAPSNLKQVDGSIVKKNDGTLEASLTFVTEKGKEALLPIIGSSHPDETNLECYNKTITYGVGELITCTCAYFGIGVVKTSPVVSYDGGTNNDPIETHPKFGETDVNGLAGTSSSPKNGAEFDSETGEFIGFTGEDAGDLLGVQYYLTPANNVSLTYWTTTKPNLNRRMSIVGTPSLGSGRTFFKPPNVKNYLLVDMPYRVQGSLYQVTEQYIGSASGGWNKLIY